MKKFLKYTKKYKWIIVVNLAVIITITIFPMKELTSKYISGGNRTGVIMTPNIVISQKFNSELDNIERVSLLLSTINKGVKCEINISLYDENKKLIEAQKFDNSNLKNVADDDNMTTDYVNFYPKTQLKNIKNKDFYINVSTDCDNIVKLQYYNAELNDESAVYDGQQTIKKVAIRYSGSKDSNQVLLYPVTVFIVSCIVALGGKNEKK